MGCLAAVLIGPRVCACSDCPIDDVGINATSVHKTDFSPRIFPGGLFQIAKPNKYGVFHVELFALDSLLLLVLHQACARGGA